MKRALGLKSIAALAVGICVGPIAIEAQAGTPLGYTGGTYTQNFDGLPTNVTNASQTLTGKGPFDFVPNITNASGLEGWQLTTGGSGANVEFHSQDGSLVNSAARGVNSLGINGSTDRAVGGTSTSNQIGRWGLILQNNTASTTFTEISVSFTGELWRRGDINFSGPPVPYDQLTFDYGSGTDILNFSTATVGNYAPLRFAGPMTSGFAGLTSLSAVDGNNPLNRVPLYDTITGLNWGPGQTLALVWTAQDLSGQDDSLAIDDFSFSAASAPSHIAGDFHIDNVINSLDFDDMMKALVDLKKYQSDNHLTNGEMKEIGDVNKDNAVDNGDMQALLNLLIQNGEHSGSLGQAANVPEPSSFVLAGLGLFTLTALQTRRRRRLRRT